ncbi:type II secretion system protein GspL [Roseateles chitinivorans]|uniref:type II secretion system protein GspL n=1 Tax=Roseateles chitinivorans TaxID=2917965 RepID=UPI003D67E4F6
MSTLLILLPASPPQNGAAPHDYEFWFSHDAQAPAHARGHGQRAPLDAMPHADRVVLLLGDDQVSWLPAQLPKIKGAKLRSAIVGVMEDHLLEDPERLHLALMESRDIDGQSHWIAVTAREPLRTHLQAMEAAGLMVESLRPLSWPQAPMARRAATSTPVPTTAPGCASSGPTASPPSRWTAAACAAGWARTGGPTPRCPPAPPRPPRPNSGWVARCRCSTTPIASGPPARRRSICCSST